MLLLNVFVKRPNRVLINSSKFFKENFIDSLISD